MKLEYKIKNLRNRNKGLCSFQILKQEGIAIHQSFTASNGWKIESMYRPEIQEEFKRLFLRGKFSKRDLDKIIFEKALRPEVEKALEEFKAGFEPNPLDIGNTPWTENDPVRFSLTPNEEVKPKKDLKHIIIGFVNAVNEMIVRGEIKGVNVSLGDKELIVKWGIGNE